MHCQGCQNLIAMSLTEEGLTDVMVDLHSMKGTFTSAKPESEILSLLNEVFSQFTQYSYENLKIIEAKK